MSKADEMFKELGYRNVRENEHWIVYKGKEKDIDFNKKYKTIEVENGMESKKFNMQELQAINEKVGELRMDKINEIWKDIIKNIIY